MLLKDADELKKAMERMLCTGKEPDKERYTCDVVCCVIDEAPTVDAEPVRHGKWIYGITLNHEWKKCSECLVSQDIFGCFTYCPNCGAKMDQEV